MASISGPGAAPQPTEKQLKLSLKNTKYVHPSTAAKQIVSSLDIVDLKPSIKEHTLTDGKRMDLMQLGGIVVVKIIDKQYNIPVRVWLLRGFPKEKPLIYIHPSPDLALSTVEYVDSQGKVTLPYLEDWKEGRSDLSTLFKLLAFKFSQQCPVYQVRAPNFSFNTAFSSGSNHSSPVHSRKFFDNGSHSSAQEQETKELRGEIECKDHEIASYKKTIKALSVEMDELRTRVRDLEQEKHESQLFSSAEERVERAASSGAYEGAVAMLEERKAEVERLEQSLQEEREKLAKETKEKEKVKSRLDSKVSDLTQTREKIAILEVEKEDYQLRLQRAVRDLKHSKMHVRELVSIKRNLMAKVSALETALSNMHERSGSSYCEDSSGSEEEEEEEEEGADGQEEELEVSEVISEPIVTDSEGVENLVQIQDSSEETALASLTEELVGHTDAAQQLQSTHLDQQDQESLENSIDSATHTDLKDSPPQSPTQVPAMENQEQSDTETKEDSPKVETLVAYAEKQIQVGLAIAGEDKDTQVDTLTEVISRYKQLSEKKHAELSVLKEEITGMKISHQKALKESEGKIHQLLRIKERLTAKNAELSQKVDHYETTNFRSTLNNALHSIQELERGMMGGSQRENESEQLRKTQAEMDELKKAHRAEIQGIIQKVAKANMKVKEEELKLMSEIKDLKMKLETAQQQLQTASNTATLRGTDVDRANVPENCIISFMEVEADSLYSIEGGSWGPSTEVTFRGKRVTARSIPKESLAQYPVHVTHKQVNTMAHLHHPNIVQFIAIAMDAPAGLMILTELMTCSLREAYQSQLLKSCKLPVLLDIALALNFLHLQKRPVVHSNLSSSCVMVEEGGGEGEWRAKLSDIGSSTSLMVLAENKEREAVYVAPEVTSTPQYRPSTASDLYSYGVLMSEVATNSLPANSPSLFESVTNLKPSLPQISCLVQCCLATNPEHRPLMGNMVKKIKNLVVNKIQIP